jgi:hypothetical protein
MDDVLHNEDDEFNMKGCAIVYCPCCSVRGKPLDRNLRDKLEALREISGMFGDDMDGYANFAEDQGLV